MKQQCSQKARREMPTRILPTLLKSQAWGLGVQKALCDAVSICCADNLKSCIWLCWLHQERSGCGAIYPGHQLVGQRVPCSHIRLILGYFSAPPQLLLQTYKRNTGKRQSFQLKLFISPSQVTELVIYVIGKPNFSLPASALFKGF